MTDIEVHLRRNLERYEREGDDERAKIIKKRLAELSAPEVPKELAKPAAKPAAAKPAAKKPAAKKENK